MSNFLDQIPTMVFSYIGGGIFLLIILYKFYPKIFLSFHKPFFFDVISFSAFNESIEFFKASFLD